MMTNEYQSMAANAVAHAAVSVQQIAGEYARPSVLWRPALTIDGNKWCALYGANLQDGVAGFGDSPAEAMHNFDCEWHKKLEQKP
jgi:hypothetical protein